MVKFNWMWFACVICLVGFLFYQQATINSLKNSLTLLAQPNTATNSSVTAYTPQNLEQPLPAKNLSTEHVDDSVLTVCNPSDSDGIGRVTQLSARLQQTIDRNILSRYSVLMHALELSEEDEQALNALLIRAESLDVISVIEGPEVDLEGDIEQLESEIRDLLGEEGFVRYDGFRSFGTQTHQLVNSLQQTIGNKGASPLSFDQEQALNLLLVSAKSNEIADKYGSLEEELNLAARELDGSDVDLLSLRQKLLIERVMREAELVLNSDQLEAFEEQGLWDYLL